MTSSAHATPLVPVAEWSETAAGARPCRRQGPIIPTTARAGATAFALAPSLDPESDRLRIVLAQGNVLPRRHFLIELAGIANSQVVGVVSDVTRALAVIRKTRPDVVVLDFLLGGGGALHVLDSVGPREAASFIVTTPHAYDEYRGACAARGVKHILSSYPDHEELSAALAAVRADRHAM